MEALEEIKLKSNFKFIHEWLHNLSVKSNEKKNVNFTNEVLEIKKMVEENWIMTLNMTQEIRLLEQAYDMQKLVILELSAKIEKLNDEMLL